MAALDSADEVAALLHHHAHAARIAAYLIHFDVVMKRVALMLLLAAAACQKSGEPKIDVERGRLLISQYGCNVCHAIPGVTGPQGSIGPSLEGLASRPTISNGKVQNTPENLAKFVHSPASLNPSSNMPGLAMPAQDAEEIAKYLGTLK